MIQEIARLNQPFQKTYFAICPLALSFQTLNQANINLYFKKDQQEISTYRIYPNLIEANKVFMFDQFNKINPFEIAKGQSIYLWYGFQTSISFKQSIVEQQIQKLKLNIVNQTLKQQNGQNYYQNTVYLTKIKAQLKYLVATGSNIQNVLKNIETYSISKQLYTFQSIRIVPAIDQDQKQIIQITGLVQNKPVITQQNLHQKAYSITTQTVYYKINQAQNNLFSSNNSYLVPNNNTDQQKLYQFSSKSNINSNTELSSKDPKQNVKAQQQNDQQFFQALDLNAALKLKLSASDMQIGAQIQEQVKQLQTQKQTYQLTCSQNLTPILQKQYLKPIPLIFSQTFIKQQKQQQQAVRKNKFNLLIIFALIFLTIALFQHSYQNIRFFNSKKNKNTKINTRNKIKNSNFKSYRKNIK